MSRPTWCCSILPFAGLFDFVALPPLYLLIISGIVGLYVLATELTKRWFFRRYLRWTTRQI